LAKKAVSKSRKKKSAGKTVGKRSAKRKVKSARPAAKKKSVKAKARKPAAKTPKAKVSAKRRPARASAVPALELARPAKPARGLPRRECEPFRLLLLEKRLELAGDVTTLQREALNRNRQDAAGDLSNMPIHMADLGTDNYEQEFTLGLIEGERAVLREIDEALQRIEEGTYGVCVATGRRIAKARLKAKPWAKYCYEYTLAQERGQKGRF